MKNPGRFPLIGACRYLRKDFFCSRIDFLLHGGDVLFLAIIGEADVFAELISVFSFLRIVGIGYAGDPEIFYVDMGPVKTGQIFYVDLRLQIFNSFPNLFHSLVIVFHVISEIYDRNAFRDGFFKRFL
mgnify:CR=1 FL=1